MTVMNAWRPGRDDETIAPYDHDDMMRRYDDEWRAPGSFFVIYFLQFFKTPSLSRALAPAAPPLLMPSHVLSGIDMATEPTETRDEIVSMMDSMRDKCQVFLEKAEPANRRQRHTSAESVEIDALVTTLSELAIKCDKKVAKLEGLARLMNDNGPFKAHYGAGFEAFLTNTRGELKTVLEKLFEKERSR
jgi:hypothetical protein